MTADHALAVLDDALVLGKPEICNADQGSQFTGSDWVNALKNCDISVSHDGAKSQSL